MNWQIVPLEKRDRGLCREAAEMLAEEFRAFWPDAWPTLMTRFIRIRSRMRRLEKEVACWAGSAVSRSTVGMYGGSIRSCRGPSGYCGRRSDAIPSVDVDKAPASSGPLAARHSVMTVCFGCIAVQAPLRASESAMMG